MKPSELIEIDKLIQAGEIEESKIRLAAIRPLRLPREQLSYFANLLRRTGQADEALKVLRTFVRPKSKTPQKALVGEVFEYAVSLISLGAINEGCKLLEPISAEEHPEKLLHLAFARISLWNYEAATEILEKYLAVTPLNSYPRLIGSVNLLSCYVYLEYDKSEQLIEELLSQTHDQKHKRLRCSIFRFKTQRHLSKNEIPQAKESLEQSMAYVESGSSIDALLFEKWRVITELQEHGPSLKVRGALNALRPKAEELQSVETHRDIDFYEALYFDDREKLLSVYFGTPYKSYREKIIQSYQRHFQRSFTVPETYTRTLRPLRSEGQQKVKGTIRIDNGANSFSQEKLRPGQLPQALFRLLVSDFYKPVELYKIHNDLFTEHFFNSSSTVTRIRQLVHRLNVWFDEALVPLQIHSRKGFYTMNPSEVVDIVISPERAINAKLEQFCGDLRKVFEENQFTSKEAAKSLQIPYRTFMEHLQEAMQASLIVKYGLGPNSKYCLSLQVENPS